MSHKPSSDNEIAQESQQPSSDNKIAQVSQQPSSENNEIAKVSQPSSDNEIAKMSRPSSAQVSDNESLIRFLVGDTLIDENDEVAPDTLVVVD